MRTEVCRHCWKAVVTDVTSSGLYCSLFRDEDPEWVEKISKQPATPAGCHYVGQKYHCADGRKAPAKCPFLLEHLMAEDG